MKEVFIAFESGADFAPKMANWVEEAGFVGLKGASLHMMLDITNSTPCLAVSGVASTVIAVTVLTGYTNCGVWGYMLKCPQLSHGHCSLYLKMG